MKSPGRGDVLCPASNRRFVPISDAPLDVSRATFGYDYQSRLRAILHRPRRRPREVPCLRPAVRDRIIRHRALETLWRPVFVRTPEGETHVEEIPDRVGSRAAAGGVPTAAADGQPAACHAAETVVRRVLQHRSIGLVA